MGGVDDGSSNYVCNIHEASIVSSDGELNDTARTLAGVIRGAGLCSQKQCVQYLQEQHFDGVRMCTTVLF